MTELNEEIKRELRRVAHATQDAARTEHEGDAEALSKINEMAEMLYELELDQFEGHLKPVLAFAFHQGLVAVQQAINDVEGNIGPDTILRIENPYV